MRAQAEIVEAAISELRKGRTGSHWMGFVFPLLMALGVSRTAKFYGVTGLDEATAYIEHTQLGPRLEAARDAVHASGARSLYSLFGLPDDLKVCSAMILFAVAAPDGPYEGALERWCGGEPDPCTTRLLRQAEREVG